MLEAYSINLNIEGEGPLSFNNVSIKKGCTTELSAPATVQLNKAGVYMVCCDISVEPTAAGDINIQLTKNGIAQPQAKVTTEGTAGETAYLGFTTLVQVKENNTCSCISSPTILQVMTNTVGTYPIASIKVTKIC